MTVRILIGDVRDWLAHLPDASVHCCVTSPPYWGLRDYGVDGQIGLEATLDDWVTTLVDVFREVRRVLRSDGTLWLNLGDAYATGTTAPRAPTTITGDGVPASWSGRSQSPRSGTPSGLKPKDLMMMPARVALALQEDGWWLRSEIIWSKPNPMPESVTDRPTSAHEKLFLLSKSERYFYDQEAVREPYTYGRDHHRNIDNPPESHVPGTPKHSGLRRSGNKARKPGNTQIAGASHVGRGFPWEEGTGRNLRNVWTIATQSYPEAHFATFPKTLVEPCIKAGCPKDGTVLDPFAGAGTTGLVADQLGRNAILIDLNPEYAAMAQRRIEADGGMFAKVAAE